MNRIVELPPSQLLDWNDRDRTFTVESELKLHLVNSVLTYEVTAVTPYEKTYPPWRTESRDDVSFAALVGERVAAQVVLTVGWNGYAHIENLVVAHEFRRQGLARDLIERAVSWAESAHLSGLMAETQTNNVCACKLYESCGFRLQGFDSSLYRGLKTHSQEVALFWYRQTSGAAQAA
jgi:streptothricin acetyltransferase